MQYLFHGMDNIRNDEFVLLSNGVSVLFVLLTENPTVHSLRYRYLLLLEQTQQGLHQDLPIVIGEKV